MSSAVAMTPARFATPRLRLQFARGVVVSSRATGRLAATSALRPVALAASFASRRPSRAAARVAPAGPTSVASRAAPFRRRSFATPAASSGATGGLVAQVPAENLPTNYFDKALDDEDDDAVIDPPSSASLADVMPYLCLLYTSPSPRDRTRSRMPSSA